MNKYLTEEELAKPKECPNCGIHSDWRYRKGRGRDCKRCKGKGKRMKVVLFKDRCREGLWHCAKCEKPHELREFFDLDHIVPRSQGGLDVPENLQILCPNCHREKSIADGTMRSWLVDADQQREYFGRYWDKVVRQRVEFQTSLFSTIS